MRVLVVDQDSSLLTAITRSLGEYFSIDAVTTKADCLDLVRVNDFEVIVAGERLEDGSGLELLGQLVKHRPNMIRIFAAERERLKLLKGRLGPFGLFRTLAYPIETRQLLAALSAAGGTQDEAVDATSIQHAVLGDEAPEETAPALTPPRQSRAKTNSASPQEQAPRQTVRTPARKVRTAQTARVSKAAMTVPVHTATASSAPAPAPQAARSGSARTPGASGSRLRVSAGRAADSLSEASQIAVAARSRNSQLLEETATKRSAFFVGAGVVVVLGAMGIALKLFSAKDESATSTSGVPAVRAPHFSAEVAGLVADTETAFQQDDFKRARTNVQTLQQIAPDHPRLSFFESLLRRRGENSASQAAATAASAAKTARRNASVPIAHAAQATEPLSRAGTTAVTGTGSSSPATFAGKTLEASTRSGVQQRPIAPSQAAADPVSPSASSPSVTQEPRLVQHVPAAYPPSAASRGIEGVVDVSFWVAKDGTVTDVTVVHADPADVFNHSAIAAVSRWKYEPKTLNGAPVEAHMQLQLQFKMDQLEP
jgi:TonB family protein